jgi:hypothetical protein
MLPSHTTTVSFCHEWMTTSKTLQELETCAYFVTPPPPAPVLSDATLGVFFCIFCLFVVSLPSVVTEGYNPLTR